MLDKNTSQLVEIVKDRDVADHIVVVHVSGNHIELADVGGKFIIPQCDVNVNVRGDHYEGQDYIVVTNCTIENVENLTIDESYTPVELYVDGRVVPRGSFRNGGGYPTSGELDGNI